MRTEIRLAGTGGMGVVLAGVILGHAAVTFAGLEAIQGQSYGSEARGTAAKSEVIISDEPINYPKVRESDYFIVMSQKALEMYLSGAKKGSVVLADPDLVKVDEIEGYEVVVVPAMKTADEIMDEIHGLSQDKCPAERRYKVNDASIEKIIELLQNNAPRGLLYHRDELIGLFKKMEKPV